MQMYTSRLVVHHPHCARTSEEVRGDCISFYASRFLARLQSVRIVRIQTRIYSCARGMIEKHVTTNNTGERAATRVGA